MIKYIMSRRVHERGLIGIGFCLFFFALGYFILEYVRTKDDPPLGDGIYILIGSTFIFTSILGFVVILRFLYTYKKKKVRRERKRKKYKLFYLKDNNRRKKND